MLYVLTSVNVRTVAAEVFTSNVYRALASGSTLQKTFRGAQKAVENSQGVRKSSVNVDKEEFRHQQAKACPSLGNEGALYSG
jgi:hypothetical protein